MSVQAGKAAATVTGQAGSMPPPSPVTSVFGRVGAVLAQFGDYAASLVSNDSGVPGATVKDALNALLLGSPVSSVFGRVGAVVAQLGDYAASLVSNDSSVPGATVKDALDNLSTSAFKTVLDLDFTSQPTQVLSPDGPYVIAGLPWTKVHSSGDLTPMQVTAGVGLVIKPTAGSNYDQSIANISGPWIWLPFSALALPPDFNWASRYRVWLSLGAGSNLTSAFDGCFFGVSDVNSTKLANVQNVGPSGTTFAAYWSGRVGGTTASDGMSAATQLTAFHEATLSPAIKSMIAYSAGLAPGAAFPDAAAFDNPAVFSTNTTNGVQATIAASERGLLIGAKRAGSGTALQVVVQRVRLDVEG
jgi:hypothetical protein